MPLPPRTTEPLATITAVLEFHATRPTSLLPGSIELETSTRAAARAAIDSGVELPALSAELGRLARDALPGERDRAGEAWSVMGRWAAHEYYAAFWRRARSGSAAASAEVSLGAAAAKHAAAANGALAATEGPFSRPHPLGLLLRAIPDAGSVEELSDIRVLAELRFGRLPPELREAITRRQGELEPRHA